jgi:TPR repeat protein
MGNLAAMYMEGLGVEKNPAEGFKWFQRGANAGDRNAMYNLGRLYETGDGGSANPTEAMRWYKRAAELGHPDANEAFRRVQAKP